MVTFTRCASSRTGALVFQDAPPGIVAHTLSSFNMHGDYHMPTDDVSRVDFAHMTGLVDVAVRAARLLADSPKKPEWKPGGKP